jgi:hypothetical protein
VTAASTRARAIAVVALSASASAGGGVLINEVDADNPGTDTLEFVELYDGGVGSTPLDGLVVVLYNGNGDTSYAAFDLDGFSTDANGFFALGDMADPGVDLVIGPPTRSRTARTPSPSTRASTRTSRSGLRSRSPAWSTPSWTTPTTSTTPSC